MNDTLRLKIMGPSLLSTIRKYFNNPGSIPKDKFLAVCQWLTSSFCETNNLFTWYLKTAYTWNNRGLLLGWFFIWQYFVFCQKKKKKKTQFKNLFLSLPRVCSTVGRKSISFKKMTHSPTNLPWLLSRHL